MAVHPLRPATHHRHGGPLPHHLANGPRTHPSAEPKLLSYLALVCMASYSALSCVSTGYSHPRGRLSTCYSPVRRSRYPRVLTARLACLKRAASVRSEPGSNSPSFNSGPKTGLISRSTLSTPYPSGYSTRTPVFLFFHRILFVIELTRKPSCFQNKNLQPTAYAIVANLSLNLLFSNISVKICCSARSFERAYVNYSIRFIVSTLFFKIFSFLFIGEVFAKLSS